MTSKQQEIKFKPTFYEIELPKKMVKVVVTYAHGCDARFTYIHNSISGTYFGLKCNSFTNEICGLLRVFPTFFDEVGDDYRKELEKLGIERVEAPESMKSIYALIGNE